ncbi:LysR family transcriptional regulator [Streptomyces albipurpureus]|uniref:LysR substrate-binding domain-containing protein n=1 Tax=Streptomyces albipurpureus TaxID=2897419 RepID=A0ABT0UQB7_9ACTN|nr:LysR substrate-binding domain-containing protein [Streptomyces sp. CWNU-1]MCM2389815.1 LysR substrate-binding domain-containing protein [Streptomyces sp. CWNU-1]
MLNSARLHVLLEIARRGTIVAAAQALHLSPSAISHQLARLEQELGVALVERAPQSLRLTAAGQRLAEHAQAIADLMAVAQDDLRGHSAGEAGLLRLGFFASSGLELLPRALSVFAAQRPQVELELILGQPHELLPDLEAGRLDAAVVFEHPLDPWCRQSAVDVDMFFDEPQLVVVPLRHRLGQRAAVRLAQLEGETWIGTRGAATGEPVLERACAAEGFLPRVRCRSDHYQVTINLARAGMGIALVPALGIGDTAGVHVCRLDHPQLHRRIGVATRATNRNPLLQAFLTDLRAAADEVGSLLEAQWA